MPNFMHVEASKEESGGHGKTFVNKSFPMPFQKTLTVSLAVNGE